MAPKRSAGILLFQRRPDRSIHVLLAHPGGPFWARKDEHAWSIPKGEHDDDEDAAATAEREFAEELGTPLPSGPRHDLGERKQPNGKLVRVWAVEGELDPAAITSNTFEIEWPPKSGRMQSFPEVDRADWFTVDEARTKLHIGQVPFLDDLLAALERRPDDG